MNRILLKRLPRTDLTQRDADTLCKLAFELGDNSVAVEIGSYLGASAICLASSFAHPGSQLCCVDPWSNRAMSEGARDTYAEFLCNIESVKEHIRPIRAHSDEAADQFRREIDLLFIDGDHSLDGCRRDLLCWLPKVRPGSVVALHDFGWADGVREAIRDYLWPVQEGGGHWEGNIYWARIGSTPEETSSSSSSTKVSLIVPTSKTDSFDADWFSHLVAAGVQNDEVCVVRNGQSTSVSKTQGAPLPSNFTEVVEPTYGTLAGRHRGFQEVTGNILIYFDDDIRLTPDWRKAMLEPFEDPSVHLVGCRYLPEYEADPPKWLQGMWTNDSRGCHLVNLSLLDYGTATEEIDPLFIWGNCYAIRRQSLVKLGGFHPDNYPRQLRRYRGDGETAPSFLARQLKLKTIYQGKASLYHHVPRSRMTPEYFERRAFDQGISDSYTHIREKGQAPEGSWKDPLRPIKRFLLKPGRAEKTSPEEMENRVAWAYKAGYDFHQREVRNDSALLQWVLREDYWDYRLPDGWERQWSGENK